MATENSSQEQFTNVSDENEPREAQIAHGSKPWKPGTRVPIVPSQAPAERYPIDLPNPNFREVAGDVRRSSNRIARAEPPPTPTTMLRQEIDTPRRRGRREGRRSQRPNDGSGSDSDEDDGRTRRTSSDDGSRIVKQKQAQQDKTEDAGVTGDSSNFFLSKDETQRLNLLRTLHQLNERTDSIRQHRSECRKRGEVAKREVASKLKALNAPEKLAWISPSRRTLHLIEYNDVSLQKYLDQTLYGDIGDILDTDSQAQSELPVFDEMMVDMQLKFIRQCRMFDGLEGEANSLNAQQRIVGIIRTMQQDLLDYVRRREISDEKDSVELATTFMRDVLHASRGRNSRSFRPILDELKRKIVSLLASEIETEQAGLQVPPSKDPHDSQSIAEFVGSLTNDEYKEWILRDMDPAVVRHCLFMWRQHQQEKAAQTYRKHMKSARINIQQEFLPGIIKPGVVSLILFKGRHPTTVKHVSAEDLKRVGWVEEHCGYQSSYWRYEVHDHLVFRVTMDGEVQGMLQGDETFLTLDEIFECESGQLRATNSNPQS